MEAIDEYEECAGTDFLDHADEGADLHALEGGLSNLAHEPPMLQLSHHSAELSDSVADSSVSRLKTISGVLYGRSVRSGYACLHLYCLPERMNGSSSNDLKPKDDDPDADADDDDASFSAGETLLLRLQLVATTTTTSDSGGETRHPPVQLRSHIRRFCKPGDLILVTPQQGGWRHVSSHVETQWQDMRLVIDLASIEEAHKVLRVQERRYWKMGRIQACQRQHCGRAVVSSRHSEEDPSLLAPLVAPPTKQSLKGGPAKEGKQSALHHGGLLKRTQGEYLKNFLCHMILFKLGDLLVNADPETWAVTSLTAEELTRARDYLNQGTGVLDVAGGSGHVSMAFGLDGIQSTIVDPRDKVGKLPGRDRKLWNRAWKRGPKETLLDGVLTGDQENADTGELYCQPVQYQVYRAWFGKPPEVRHEDQAALPICDGGSDNCDPILRDSRAIAALHPDEATDAIVDTAVRRRIPFVIVPCCVFYRLFSDRRMPGDATTPVSTYIELLNYLQAKDEKIQRTLLPFEGANTLLWSVF